MIIETVLKMLSFGCMIGIVGVRASEAKYIPEIVNQGSHRITVILAARQSSCVKDISFEMSWAEDIMDVECIIIPAHSSYSLFN